MGDHLGAHILAGPNAAVRKFDQVNPVTPLIKRPYKDNPVALLLKIEDQIITIRPRAQHCAHLIGSKIGQLKHIRRV